MFDPPKVFIELAEYNELKLMAENAKNDVYVKAAKQVIAMLFVENDIRKAFTRLKESGITISFTGDPQFAKAEDIQIIKNQ